VLIPPTAAPAFETVFVDENPEVVNALADKFARRWSGSVRFVLGNLQRS
jgi:hypothetical protein